MMQPAQLLKKYSLHIGALSVLLLVLAAYARPDLVAELANLVWLCFK
jgi:hypothetical protein